MVEAAQNGSGGVSHRLNDHDGDEVAAVADGTAKVTRACCTRAGA